MKRVNLAITVIIAVMFLSGMAYGGKTSAEYGKELFNDANSLYKALLKDSKKEANVEIWQKLADAFYGIFKLYNNSDKAPTSLFLS